MCRSVHVYDGTIHTSITCCRPLSEFSRGTDYSIVYTHTRTECTINCNIGESHLTRSLSTVQSTTLQQAAQTHIRHPYITSSVHPRTFASLRVPYPRLQVTIIYKESHHPTINLIESPLLKLYLPVKTGYTSKGQHPTCKYIKTPIPTLHHLSLVHSCHSPFAKPDGQGGRLYGTWTMERGMVHSELSIPNGVLEWAVSDYHDLCEFDMSTVRTRMSPNLPHHRHRHAEKVHLVHPASNNGLTVG